MSLRRRLIVTMAYLFVAVYIWLRFWIQDELYTHYAFVIEDMLVDTAHMMAAGIEKHDDGDLRSPAMATFLNAFVSRPIAASIQGKEKSSSALDFYVVDQAGMVVYSTRAEDLDQDYSQWNDVYLTLRGKYGVRSTRTDPDNPLTSVYYVAAPIRRGGDIIGAVSVIKSEDTVLKSLAGQTKNLLWGLTVGFILLAGFSFLVSFWITKPVESLKAYVKGVSEGRKLAPPKLMARELRELYDEFESMRQALDGQAVVEQHTQSLTHEMKSPLTAIRGAAELCREPMADDRRQKFLGNIIRECGRAEDLLDRLLRIAALESQTHLEDLTLVDWRAVALEIRDGLAGRLEKSGITLQIEGEAACPGQAFLCSQSLRNLVENSLAFSQSGQSITIELSESAAQVQVRVLDEGQGIPDYAQEKIFDKFFSLERPGTDAKSSGLGLAFVRQVMLLHHGTVTVKNRQDGKSGVEALMSFPRTPQSKRS